MCTRPNISLSATTTTSELFTGPSHCKYIPPHPQKGTKYHRYTLLLLPHADPAAPIEVPKLDAEQRAHFDVRAFAAHYGLDGAKGGGAHMWREVWDEEVSNIYMGRLRKCFRLHAAKQFLINRHQTPRSRCTLTRARRTRTRSSGSRSGTWLDLALCEHYVMHALVNHNAFALGFDVHVRRVARDASYIRKRAAYMCDGHKQISTSSRARYEYTSGDIRYLSAPANISTERDFWRSEWSVCESVSSSRTQRPVSDAPSAVWHR
jgi:hypothetical protein